MIQTVNTTIFSPAEIEKQRYLKQLQMYTPGERMRLHHLTDTVAIQLYAVGWPANRSSPAWPY